jgi:class 3 adenylate cyclase
MSETVTKSAKYIFLDIVGFTHNRSVEAQTEIIGALNAVVLDSISEHHIDAEDLILLPTGDGICLVLLAVEDPYDIHVRIALSLVEGIEKHNQTAKDEQRRFKIRVGINSNVDNLITDVNGDRNIAGAGINLAQRVMSAADGNQILVGQPVFDMLSQREQYMHAFRSFVAVAKHGLRLNAYQLVIDGFPGLDVTTPSQFREESPAPEKLPEIAAYYMAQAMVHRAEIVSCMGHGQSTYSLVVLLWMKAIDSSTAKHRAPHELAGSSHARKSDEGFVEQFNFYEAQDFWVCADLAHRITGLELRSVRQYFEGAGVSNFGFHFVTPSGQERLKAEWPDIWEEFDLEAHSNLES